MYIDSGTHCSCGYDITAQNTFFISPVPGKIIANVSSAALQGQAAAASPISEVVYEGEWRQLRDAAIGGSTDAMLKLNERLRSRRYIAEANKWLHMAAERGDAFAQCMYGHLLDMGDDIKQDFAEAGKWYRLASKQGYAPASWFMGNMYQHEEGEGAGPDFNEAVRWFLLAAEQGMTDGWYDLGGMFLYGEGVGGVVDKERALHFYRLAAEHGNVAAQFVLGEMYAEGDEIPQNIEEARKWYSLAASNGDEDAKLRLEALKK